MATAAVTAPPESRPRKLIGLWRDWDQVTHLITFIFAASVFLVTVFRSTNCGFTRVPRARSLVSVFSRGKVGDPVAEQFGALPFIYGTVLTSFIALLSNT